MNEEKARVNLDAWEIWRTLMAKLAPRQSRIRAMLIGYFGSTQSRCYAKGDTSKLP